MDGQKCIPLIGTLEIMFGPKADDIIKHKIGQKWFRILRRSDPISAADGNEFLSYAPLVFHSFFAWVRVTFALSRCLLKKKPAFAGCFRMNYLLSLVVYKREDRLCSRQADVGSDRVLSIASPSARKLAGSRSILSKTIISIDGALR